MALTEESLFENRRIPTSFYLKLIIFWQSCLRDLTNFMGEPIKCRHKASLSRSLPQELFLVVRCAHTEHVAGIHEIRSEVAGIELRTHPS